MTRASSPNQQSKPSLELPSRVAQTKQRANAPSHRSIKTSRLSNDEVIYSIHVIPRHAHNPYTCCMKIMDFATYLHWNQCVHSSCCRDHRHTVHTNEPHPDQQVKDMKSTSCDSASPEKRVSRSSVLLQLRLWC